MDNDKEERSLAPDPLTAPDKCSGIRVGFAVVSVLSVALFACFLSMICWPHIFASLKAALDEAFGH